MKLPSNNRSFLSSLVRLVVGLSALRNVPGATAYTALSDDFLRKITHVSDEDFNIKDGSLMAPLLIPRVVGTSGQAKAQSHFVDFFQSQLPDWDMSWFNSTSTTPLSNGEELLFSNLLFRREPPGLSPGQANYLTLVAHYDSKIEPEGFIGATDSAAPCAMLMHVARVLDGYLSRQYDDLGKRDELDNFDVALGVQVLFLDGEEAFLSWTDEDSTYGARALAEEWENTANPAMSTFRSPLGQIDMFVLLDLLGEANPRIPSYFQTTHWAYQKMAEVEDRLRQLDLLESTPRSPFLPDGKKEADSFGRAGISDDHLPFMRRGVPILHIIANPFPVVWHHIEDDGEHLDMPTTKDWARICTAFAFEWLDLMAVGPNGTDSQPGQ